jgi:hypothetical protein
MQANAERLAAGEEKPMHAVRFSCGDASAEEQVELAEELAALDGTEILESGEVGGAAFADVIIVALITVGGPIVSDAVKTFGKWLLSRRSRGSQATDGPVRVTVEGLRGSCTITITSDTDTAQLDLAAVGTVTEIREAE